MNPHFLTKIEIDYELAYKRRLVDSYAWHQRSWDAFPDRDGEKRDFLTRLDEVDGGFRFLILSPREPVRPAWCPEQGWFTKPIPGSFLQFDQYQFSILANPSKKVRSNADGNRLKNSRRVPLTSRETLVEWLLKKGQQHGFETDGGRLQTISRSQQVFLKSGKMGVHSVVEFSGVLRVTDQDAFTSAAVNGIGPAKAFGLGMLCLSPVN